MSTSEVALGILLDYIKAFDLIDHMTLLEKFHKLNFTVQALKPIYSYVSEQKQFVRVYDKSSSAKLNSFGVPQGSILGSILFNLYKVDLVENLTCVPYNMLMIPSCTNIQTRKIYKNVFKN